MSPDGVSVALVGNGSSVTQDEFAHSEDCGEPWDAVVLGAGVSGLISARILQDQGLQRILVIDQYPRVGGNHIDVAIGAYTFDIGTFLFQERSQLMSYFPEIEQLYLPVRESWSRITPQGAIRTYPFSVKDEVIARGPVEWLLVGLSFLRSRVMYRRPRNAREFACYWIGERIFTTSGLENYIQRFYGVPAHQIETAFAEKRMRWIADSASMASIVRRLRRTRPRAPGARSLVRPQTGFATVYDVVQKDLERRGASFKLATSLRRIRSESGLFHISPVSGGPIRTRRLISTIPLEESLQLCGLAPSASITKTATLVSLFYSFAGERGFSTSMLYNFGRTGAWKRITMMSDFFSQVNFREFFTVEVNQFGNPSREELDAAFRAEIAAEKLFAGDLVLEGAHVLPNAYPVYNFGATAAASACIKDLRDFGVESFGRQGGFDYLPNTHDVIETVKKALG